MAKTSENSELDLARSNSTQLVSSQYLESQSSDLVAIGSENNWTKSKADSTTTPQSMGLRQQLQGKSISILVGAAVMLPILTVGTATYYFGSQTVNQQAIITRRLDSSGLSQAELLRQQQLLAVLLVGTGTTALVAGIGAGLGTKRLLDSLNQAQAREQDKAQLNQQLIEPFPCSVDLEDTLETIVEEARISLGSDRVLIYSLNRDRYGTVIAESVGSGWTSAWGKKIQDPCLATPYLQQYRNGYKYAIDNVATAGIEAIDLAKLDSIEVQASLVTPILNQEKLFGLLVAHQCSRPRHWQTFEMELLNQFAQRAGLAIDRAKLSQDLARLQIQAEQDKRWTHRLSDATAHIHQSLQQEEVLKISVEEVRRGLNCDRVLVYSLSQGQYGVVVAESVGPGWTKALGKTIKDSCFEAKYLNQYRDGRVRAIDNIYRASMSSCYIEQLESLEVKANLVTPILDGDKLFGLLVAHQCSQARAWQADEIVWVKQIATQVGFALNHVRVLAESTNRSAQVQRERQWKHYSKETMQSIRQSLQQDDVLEISVEQVRQVLNCDRVLVYSLSQGQYGLVVAESVALGWTRALGKTIKDTCFEAKYLDKDQIDPIYQADSSSWDIEQLESLEVKSSLVAPILDGDKLFGLLVAHQCSQERAWQTDEIDWIEQIARIIAFALDRLGLLHRLQQQDLLVQSLNSFTLSIGDRHLNQSQLLNIAVEQARKILGLDRTIVYQFDQRSDGIVAESVMSDYPSALGLPLKDPDLARYNQRNCSLAWANVEQAEINPDYLEQLKSLAVKAIIVAPIWLDNQLYGLLMGHQCQQPRAWEQSDINLFTQLARQLESALNRVKLKQQLTDSLLTNNSIANKQQQLLHQLEQNKTAIERLKTQIKQQSAATPDLLVQIPNSKGRAERTIKVYSTETSSLVPAQTTETKTKIELAKNRVDPSATTDLSSITQCTSEITHLCDQISQQSLAVTNSFKKVVALAHELSVDSTEINKEERNQL